MAVSSESVTDASRQRSVWILEGIKAGDNTQMLAVAEALGWPWEARRMRYRPWELVTNLALRITLAGVDAASARQLAPPWPDLVLTAGRRNEPVARWIRRSADHPVKLVHLGRPWARPDRFDLVVSTPQYFLREGGNVMVNDLPLHRISEAMLSAAAARWENELAALPRPYVVLLAGGNSGVSVFTPAKARYLGEEVARQTRAVSGAALVTTSARTPRKVVDILRESIDAPCHFFDWHRHPRERNPYLAYLALGDRFIVTGESMSMLAEACATGKPVQVFDLDAPVPGEPRRWWLNASSYRWRPLTDRLAQRLAPRRMRRDTRRIHRRLEEAGRVAPLGCVRAGVVGAANRDLERTVARVKALFEDGWQSSGKR